MADERELLIKIKADDTDLNNKVKAFGDAFNKALSKGGGSANKDMDKLDTTLSSMLKKLDNQNTSWNALQKNISKYSELVASLEGKKGMEQSLARSQTILAGMVESQRHFTDDTAKMVEYLEQANKLRTQANANRGGSADNPFLSAHSQRQLGVLTNALGGGGVLSAAKQGMEGMGEDAGKLGMGAGAVGGIAGFAASAVITKLISALGELGSAAQEAAKHISDAGGAFDKLRASQEKASYSKSAASMDTNIAGFQAWKNEMEARFWAGAKTAVDGGKDLWDGFWDNFKSGKDKADEAANKAQDKALKPLDLTGEDKISWDTLKRDRVEMERDIANERDKMEHDLANKRRDYALEVADFEREQERKKEDLLKQRQREDEDYTLNKGKLEEDQAFKTSQKKYELDRAAQQRDFALKQQDEQAQLGRTQQYAQQDLTRRQGDETQDYGIQRSRAARNFGNRLSDMAISGASGISYLQAARDYRQQQADAAQDLALKQQREKRDLAITQGREKTELGVKQGIEKRDFGNKQNDQQAQHNLDVEQHYYELRYQELELERQHTRAIEDSTIALKRLAEDTQVGRQKLGNKKSDMDYEEATTRRDFDINAQRQLRGNTESQQAFAKHLLDQNPAAFGQIAMKNPELKDALNGYQDRAGQGHYIDRATPIYQRQQAVLADIQKVQNDPNMSPDEKAKRIQTLYSVMSQYRDVYDTNGDVTPFVPQHADGGPINGTHLALVHDGEWVINPNHPDKQAQFSYLMQATKELSARGGSGLIPAFAAGGPISGIDGGGFSAGMGGGGSMYLGGRLGAGSSGNFMASDFYQPVAPIGQAQGVNNYNLNMPFSAEGMDNGLVAQLKGIMSGGGSMVQGQLQAAMDKSNADKFRSLMLMQNGANVIR